MAVPTNVGKGGSAQRPDVRRIVKDLATSGELQIRKRAGTTDMFTVLVGADILSKPAKDTAVTDGRNTPDTAASTTPDTLAVTPDLQVSYEPSSQPSPNQKRTVSAEAGSASAALDEARGRKRAVGRSSNASQTPTGIPEEGPPSTNKPTQAEVERATVFLQNMKSGKSGFADKVRM